MYLLKCICLKAENGRSIDRDELSGLFGLEMTFSVLKMAIFSKFQYLKRNIYTQKINGFKIIFVPPQAIPNMINLVFSCFL